MSKILYWHVKLFQHHQSSLIMAGGGINKAQVFEGYATDKPRFRPGAEFVIELFTAPALWKPYPSVHAVSTVWFVLRFTKKNQSQRTTFTTTHVLTASLIMVHALVNAMSQTQTKSYLLHSKK